MNVTNCKGCGRLFNVLSTERLCPDCRRKIEDKFHSVKEYLDEHRNASINEVSEQCEVSVRQIKQWIREERLTFSEESMEGIECENCGRMIRTGRFCENCKTKLANTLQSAYGTPIPLREEKKDRTSRMRFLQQ